MTKWIIEIVKRRTDTDEEYDWQVCNPGPEMRARLDQWFPVGIGGPSFQILMSVRHAPSARRTTARIIKDGRFYRVRHKGDLLTLEGAAKLMKEELTQNG
jgi:hypothetical protein